MRKFLMSDKLKLLVPGPTSGSRGELPYTNVLAVNAFGLNQSAGPWLETVSFWPGTRLGRSHRPSLFWLSKLSRTSNGLPLANVTIPLNDQPPAIVATGPLR